MGAMFPHTVTVWNRSDDETYTRTVIACAYWEDNRGAMLRRTGVSSDNGIVVLIPFSAVSSDFTVRPGDWMARGASVLDPKTARDLQAAGAVRVTAADRLDFGGLPHWEVALA